MNTPFLRPSFPWIRLLVLLPVALVTARTCAVTDRDRAAVPAWPFFAMQTATKDAAHTSVEAQVKLVKALGYDGIGAVPPGEVAPFAAACDQHGVRLWNTYFVVDIDAAVPLDPQLRTQLAPLKGRDAMLWVGLTSTRHLPSSPEGDTAAVKRVNELADLAQSLGARVALYPHAGFWVEQTQDALRVADRVNRPEVGVTFNLCHFLKVSDESRLEGVLERARPRLFVVSLNGAESGRKGGDWKELIQTLDRGSFDPLRLLGALGEIGFEGPVGFQGYGIGGDAEDNLRRTMQAWRELNRRARAQLSEEQVKRRTLRFRPDGQGGFTFDTGLLRGRLHPEGKSLGLSEVYHGLTGARLDRSNGLLSHYRVFANGQRFGGGAWDWPSTAAPLDDGGVEVRWAAVEGRPIAMRAVYRLTWPGVIEVETTIEPKAELKGFEVFLASYFEAAFTNAQVAVKTGAGAAFVEAAPDRGDWQMYARDAATRALAEDGRWKLEPHPVAWTFPAELAGPQIRAHRRAPTLGLSATLASTTADCFAAATPHQSEGHYSTYLSLFGRTLDRGETARAHVSLRIDSPRPPRWGETPVEP